MFVTKTDNKLEQQYLDMYCARSQMHDFEDVQFVQNTDRAGIFDFFGYRDNEIVLKLDVKVRDIRSDQYKDFFISKEKVHEATSPNKIIYYMLYVFTGDNQMRLFNLAFCDFKLVKDQKIHHRRANKEMTGDVYTISTSDCIEIINFGAWGYGRTDT